jgi:phosphate transport system substrate-binding protein
MKILSSIIITSLICIAASDVHAAMIKADGSSTVFPITEAVAEEFGKIGSDKVMVGLSGTGGGFKRFCRGETDISNASRPIKEKEVSACRESSISYIELPVAYDGLSVVVNPANTWVDYLTVAELKKIWEPAAQGTVTRWSQVRSGWPEEEIKLFGPGTDSGTFDYFTEVINGKTAASRGDFTASEDDNVLVEGVSSETGALGYFGLAYYEQNKSKLKLVPIYNGSENVAPSLETVQNGSYKPLSRPLFIYVNAQSLKDKPAVKNFIQFYLENTGTLSEEVGYVPLSSEDLAKSKSRVANA